MIDELLGPYRLVSELGAGGMGKVYLATVEGDAPGLPVGERVAVKVIYPHLVTDFTMFERFVREVSVGKRIRHENVVRTLDAGMEIGDQGELVYLVMEYVAGRTLGEMRREHGRLPEDLCRRVAREVSRALRGIHEAGVVHRDLKPDNVLITPDGVVKVMDLGVALLQEEALRQSRVGGFAGSLAYAAPEQFGGEGAAEADGRVDLYALGVMLFELATGEHPFHDDDIHVVIQRQLTLVPPPITSINPGISLFLAQVVAQLLEKDPDKRVRSADELFTILSEAEQSRWWRRETARMMRGDRPPLRRLPVPRATDVHGREAELAQLRGWFQEVVEGRGRAVLVDGEAGVGKSRLLDELVMLLEMGGEELEFLFGAHRPEAFASLHEALLIALREHFGRVTLAGMAREFAGQTPAGDALVRLVASEPGSPHPDAAPDLPVPFAAHVLGLLAQARPVVMLLEDLHLARGGGLDQFLALSHRVAGHRVLLAGTARRGLPDPWLAEFRALPHAQVLGLSRLGERPLSGILAQALGSGMPDEALIAAVARQSDGNPLFALEVLSEIREKSLLRQTPHGTWSTLRPLRDVEVPSGVRGVIRGRLSGLAEEDRELLQVAACVGFEFDPALVGELVGTPHREVERALARLGRSAALVRPVGERYSFDHRALRDSLYAEMPEMLRAEYHRLIGEALLRRGPPDGARAARITHHLLLAGDVDAALPHMDAALNHLDETGRHQEILLVIGRALSAGSEVTRMLRVPLLLRKALAHGALGHADTAAETVREALDAFSSSPRGGSGGEPPAPRTSVLDRNR